MDAVPHRIDIGDTFGAVYIGVIVAAMLYGLTTLQTYFYYVYYPNDGIYLKTLVSLIWVLDSGQIAVVAYGIYYYLVANYNNPAALAVGHWSFYISVVLNVTTAVIVQGYFTRQIYLLCTPKLKWFVTVPIGITVLGHFATGMEIVAFFFIKKEFSKFSEITLIAATPLAITSVLSDILIAGWLCYLLHGSKTGFKSTNTILSQLIIYAINRCLLTSVLAVIEVIVFSAKPNTFWYIGMDFVIGKLFANSLLATLNSRLSVRSAGSTVNSVHLSDLESGSPSTRAPSDRNHFVDLRYETRTQTFSDLGQERKTHVTRSPEILKINTP